MKDYQVGLTAPPFHCNCRSVTCPFFDDEFTKGEKRAARREDGKTYYVPANMNYEEWKKEYVDKDAEELEKADYLFRSHIPGENITKEKLTVIDTISNLPPKVQSALNDGTIIDIGKDGASQYDYNHDILYIAKGANKEAVIHEIGHMVENKMMNADAIEKLKRKCINQVDMKDIKTELFYDGMGTEYQVLFIQSNRLISEYQGRIYVDNMLDAIDEDGNIKYDLLWEFVSEAFREYIMNPKLLKEKNSELYNYIEEIVL